MKLTDISKMILTKIISLFLTHLPTLYPLTAPESQRVSGVFIGYKMETLVRNGLRGCYELPQPFKRQPHKMVTLKQLLECG